MSLGLIQGASSGHPRIKTTVMLSLVLSAVMGLGALPALAQVSPASLEQTPLFEALNQQMRQTMATYDYDILKMQDPFLPIEAARNRRPGDCTADGACGEPQVFTQLKLVAITMPSDGSGALASFEDGAGSSYIFRAGDQVGRNNGRILKITSSTVTVEEGSRDQRGQARITDIKLRIPDTSTGLTRSGEEMRVN